MIGSMPRSFETALGLRIGGWFSGALYAYFRLELPIDLKYDSNRLIPAVAQDAESGEVLMVAWMNAEALRLTQSSGEAHFWSRSRHKLWRKGATSGNVLHFEEIRVDRDADTLLRVSAIRPACHTGERSCFSACWWKTNSPAHPRSLRQIAPSLASRRMPARRGSRP
jgi:phosphoribosyl-AMP cyclohydrolase